MDQHVMPGCGVSFENSQAFFSLCAAQEEHGVLTKRWTVRLPRSLLADVRVPTYKSDLPLLGPRIRELCDLLCEGQLHRDRVS